MTIDLAQPGLAVDYAYAGVVRRTAPLTTILARHSAVAGVNGDFFDIGDTGAPLGLGLDRQEGLLNARSIGWNAAFYFDKAGVPEVGTLPMVARFKQHPKFALTNVNSPEVAPDSIGVYTRAWGRTSGYAITGGQTQDVRSVLIRNGRVVEKKSKLFQNKVIDGTLLVGRGQGAKDLARLKKGTKATVRWWLKDTPRMAITGNKVLINDGLIQVVDDREMHPRTAIGIDRDTNQLLLLVVDGRQSFSRGYTMVELANRMIDLGADEALNLDGGGSSTMVAKKETGEIGVVNYPSDGGQRSVPNGLEVTYNGPPVVTPPPPTATPTPARPAPRRPHPDRHADALAVGGHFEDRHRGHGGEALRYRVGDLHRPHLAGVVGDGGRYVAADRDHRRHQLVAGCRLVGQYGGQDRLLQASPSELRTERGHSALVTDRHRPGRHLAAGRRLVHDLDQPPVVAGRGGLAGRGSGRSSRGWTEQDPPPRRRRRRCSRRAGAWSGAGCRERVA